MQVSPRNLAHPAQVHETWNTPPDRNSLNHRKTVTIASLRNLEHRQEPRDACAIAAIILPVIREGATYALDQNLSETEALTYWMAPDKETFVAEQDGVIVGAYYMRPNQAGGGRYVCNCGYMTSAAATGRGIARGMCEHSREHARSRGYRAIQFNLVVSTNERAVSLWQFPGFEIAGRLPGPFRHPSTGYVDAFVMYQQL